MSALPAPSLTGSWVFFLMMEVLECRHPWILSTDVIFINFAYPHVDAVIFPLACPCMYICTIFYESNTPEQWFILYDWLILLLMIGCTVYTWYNTVQGGIWGRQVLAHFSTKKMIFRLIAKNFEQWMFISTVIWLKEKLS